MKSKVIEGKAEIKIPIDYRNKLDSKMPVFYNPIMQLNRDISIIFLNCIERKSNKPLRCLDLLSASGIRAIRIAKEVPNVDVTANDLSKKAVEYITKNVKLNKVKIKIENKAAHVLLSEQKSYDFIDIDPFGTPIPFLDAAIKRISPHGYISITATDTSALCGTYESACRRKYSAKPLRNEFMHETGIRILIKKVQEIAAQYDVALTPIFCHSSNHYMKVYFKKEVGAGRTNKILKGQGYVFYNFKTCERKVSFNMNEKPKQEDFGGLLWLGALKDQKLVERMLKFAEKNVNTYSKESISLLERISEEIDVVGSYDMHLLSKKYRFQLPKLDIFLSKLKEKGKVSRTHFSNTSFKTELNLKQILKNLA